LGCTGRGNPAVGVCDGRVYEGRVRDREAATARKRSSVRGCGQIRSHSARCTSDATCMFGGRLKEALEQGEGGDRADAVFFPGTRGPGVEAGIETHKATKRPRRAISGSVTLDSEETRSLLFSAIACKKGRFRSESRGAFKELIALDPTSFLGYYYAGRVDGGGQGLSAPRATIKKRGDINPPEFDLVCQIWQCCSNCSEFGERRNRALQKPRPTQKRRGT